MMLNMYFEKQLFFWQFVAQTTQISPKLQCFKFHNHPSIRRDVNSGRNNDSSLEQVSVI